MYVYYDCVCVCVCTYGKAMPVSVSWDWEWPWRAFETIPVLSWIPLCNPHHTTHLPPPLQCHPSLAQPACPSHAQTPLLQPTLGTAQINYFVSLLSYHTLILITVLILHKTIFSHCSISCLKRSRSGLFSNCSVFDIIEFEQHSHCTY